MTIPLILEDMELVREFQVRENCYFCHKPSRFWHENTNNPVCPTCSTRHKVAELPDHGKRIRSDKRKAGKEG